MKLQAALAIAFLGLIASVFPVAAQEGGPTPDPNQVNAIAKNLYCPVCANVPLDACGTAACIQWRQQIGDLLSQGYSQQQIYDYFVAQYGPGVLSAPPPAGFNGLLYILPAMAVVLGAVLLWLGLRSWTRSKKSAAARTEPANTASYKKRLEEQLRSRR